MTYTGDLYTETEVAELLTVAVLKARARDREELAGLRAALRVAELGGLSAAVVRKALEPQPTEPIPPASQPDDDSDPDDTDVYDSSEAELLDAALALAEEGHATGEDVQGGLDALYELIDDPDELERVAAGGTFEKAWDESKHPRGKNGHFISRDAIADAKRDPAKAAKLRAEVKPADKDKLEDALSGKTDLGTTAKRQKRDLTAEKRQKKQADRRTAMDLVYKIRDAHASGKAVAADDLHALIPHLSTLTGEELRDVRTQLFRLGATFNGERRVSERAKNLTDWARKQALDARMKEQGFGDEDAAAAKQVVGAAKPVSPEPAKPAEPQPTSQPQPAAAPQAASKPARAPKAPAAPPAERPATDAGKVVADVYSRSGRDAKHSEMNAAMRAAGAMTRKQAADALRATGIPSVGDPREQLARMIYDRYQAKARQFLANTDRSRGDAERAEYAAHQLRNDEPLISPKEAMSAPRPAAPPAVGALAKKPLADKQHLAQLAAAAPDQTTRDYLENAAHNAPGDKGTIDPADRRHQTVERLAAEHRNALAAGHTGAADHLAKVIGEYGGKLEGFAPGETAPFDGSLYDSAEKPGEGTLWTGQPARVLRQPILGPDGRVAVRGEMEPAGSAPPSQSAQVTAAQNQAAPLDRKKLYRDLVDATHAESQDYGAVRFSDLYAKLKERHPGLTKGEFRDAVHRLGRDQHIGYKGWDNSPDDLPDPELATYYTGGSAPTDENDLLMYHAAPVQPGRQPKTASPEDSAPIDPAPRTPRGTGRADDAAPTEDEIAAASRPHVPKPSVPATPVAATATGGNNPPVPPTGGGSRVGSGGMDDPMHKMTLAQLRSSGRPLFDPAKAGAFPARVGYIGRIKIGDHGAYVDYNFPNATNKAEATALAVDKARAELTPEQAHRLAVRQAFSNGHTVPSEVLADYPEIQPMGEYIDPLDRPIDPVARARRAAEDAAAAARWREIDKRHDA